MSVDELLKTAIAKHKRSEYEEAIELYLQILSANPRHVDANYLLGTLYIDYADFEKSKTYLSKANQIKPNSPYIKVNLGHLHRKMGDNDLALKYFLDAIRIMPNLFEAHLGLGIVLLDTDLGKAANALQRAQALVPNAPEVYHYLGLLSVRQGKTDDALQLFKQARRLNPKLLANDYQIGMIYLGKDKPEEAARYFKDACRNSAGDVKASYFLAIAEGRVPEKELLQHYSQIEFDLFSSMFEKHLVDKLGYTLPFKILDVLKRMCGTDIRFTSVCDLGCGTGLSGKALRGIATGITGIDISEKMIEVAREKGCYEKLYCGDLVTVLNEHRDVFDLFVATDVLIYIGNLDALLASIVSRAKPGALFLFSTEMLEGEGFTLKNTGRYAHSPTYVHEVMQVHGCTIVGDEDIDLRKDFGRWIKGTVYLARL